MIHPHPMKNYCPATDCIFVLNRTYRRRRALKYKLNAIALCHYNRKLCLNNNNNNIILYFIDNNNNNIITQAYLHFIYGSMTRCLF